jgi:hypothetical protein
MATRLIGTDSENPRLPDSVIAATQGTTAADLAPGDTLADAYAYTDAAIFDVIGGGVDYATDAETITGTSTTKVVTPAGLAAATPDHDVRNYGAVGNGTTDDTVAIQAAIDAATTNGGTVLFPAGTFIAAALVVKSNVTFRGQGVGATIVKLKASANVDLFVTENFATLTGGTTAAGPSQFRFENLCLDGNRANNTAGWPLRIYGCNYTIANVHIRNGKSGGVWTQWGSGGTNMESHWANFKIFNSEGVVLDFSGPHDSILVNGSVFNDSTQSSTAGKLVYFHGAASGTQVSNCHFWGNCAYAVDLVGGIFFNLCQAEGATTANVRFQQNYGQWVGGHIFGTTTGTEIGVELGVAAGTSAKGNLVADVMFSRFGAGSFPIKFTNTSGVGNNVITGQIGSSVTATALWTGTPNTTIGSEDRVDIRSADPNPIASSWQVPKIQSSRMWLPASDFVLYSGTPAIDTDGFWLFDASAVEAVITSAMFPPWWNTCNAYVRWANAGAGTGDVTWFIRYDFVSTGDTFGTYTNMFGAGSTAGALNVVMNTIITSATIANIANSPLVFRVERNATNASDTLTNDAKLIGVEFVRVT